MGNTAVTAATPQASAGGRRPPTGAASPPARAVAHGARARLAGPRQPACGATLGRQLAHRILVRVMADGAYAERLLAHELERSGLSPRDRAMVCMLVYGSLREAEGLDAVLAGLLARPAAGLPAAVRAALRLGAYQLLHARVPDHSAVDQSVSLVRGFGRLRGLVNAVLRRLARQAAAELAPSCGAEAGRDPPSAAAGGPTAQLLAELRARRSEAQVAAWLAACRRPPPLCLRVNLQRASPEQARARLAAAGRQVAWPPRRPGGGQDPCLWLERAGQVARLPGWRDGWFSVQDTAATWVGSLLPRGQTPRPVVLDMCAAPGGKLLQLLEAWGPEARALGCDLHPGRLGLIAAAAERLGLPTPPLACLDARRPEALRQALAEAGLPAPTHIVLDAPCSALGTLRRHPERRARAIDLAALVALQAALLDAAAATLPRGGHLLYAVCTVTQAEGCGQVANFVARHPDFRCLPPPPALDFGREGSAFCSWTCRDGTDSFFAQLLVRQ